MKHTLTVAHALASLVFATAEAGDPLQTQQASSRPRTLFNPTPRDEWRELAPDRPDITESPITVDAGAWVIETSYFDWTRDAGDDIYTVMSTNLKVGLTDRIDLQTLFDTFTWEDPVTGAGAEGFSDVTLRLKYNLWGNDGGPSAIAIFPYVKIPTGTALSNGVTEGGLMLPFSTGLTDTISLDMMAQIDAVDDGTGGYDAQFLHSAVLGFDLTESLAVYTEYFGITGPGAYQPYFSGGTTLTLNADLILDAGIRVGLSDDSEDFGLFGGFTKRF
jgi:hypothetical protein